MRARSRDLPLDCRNRPSVEHATARLPRCPTTACATTSTVTSRRSPTTGPTRSTRSTATCGAALNAAFDRFRDEEDAWVAIVTGAGRAFCAGADMRDGAGSAGEFGGTFWEKPTINSFESGWEIFKPVIAAVNGYCLGYGLTLVTWCDFVIASERAEFGFPEVGIGVPTIVGAIRLPQRINWQYAMELLLTGERIDADRAKEIGLAGWVVPHDELMDEARTLADRLVRAAPLAARATKEVAVRSQHLTIARRDPLRRDDAPGRGRDRRRGRRRPRVPRRSGAALDRPLAILRDLLDQASPGGAGGSGGSGGGG